LYSVRKVKDVSDSLAVHGKDDVAVIEYGATIDGPKQRDDWREDNRDQPFSLWEICSCGHSA
jgi:hypothetical protein